MPDARMSAELAVGSTIWVFNENHRIYPKGLGLTSGPIYREHWRPTLIVGETSRSWILQSYGEKRKVAKKGPHPGVAFTAQEVDDDCWIHEHRYSIIKHVERLREASVLRKIAELVGWKPNA